MDVPIKQQPEKLVTLKLLSIHNKEYMPYHPLGHAMPTMLPAAGLPSPAD